ncbi:MAG: hypothetical protein JL56_07255 [Desulfotomaculum sp. BICA1-6]|nr:MAG: hypothetical protein JL56_07255 [Desulfotomaculum sp. BICA1-6]
MKRLLFMLLVLMLFATPAYAQNIPASEISTFGFTDERDRHSVIHGPAFQGVLEHLKGPSYSQPLILNGNKWGGRLTDRWVAVTVENNVMYGLLLPSAMEAPPAHIVEPEELWRIPLHGSTPTKSHPTLYETSDGKKYLVIGTYSRYIDIIDVTNFERATLSDKSIQCNYATDITSAPLILNWRGHDILICTSGNTGKVFIVTDPFNKSKGKEFYTDVGPGRTSSSPAPLDGGKGFAVGLDGGANYGEFKVYYLDEILEERSGEVVQKSYNSHYSRKLQSGLCASFSVNDDIVYFGDQKSRIYMFNTKTGQGNMNDTHPAVGIFSNRSPALDLRNNLLIFPAVAREANGKIVAIDALTGKTKWAHSFTTRAQTAPVVVSHYAGTEIWAGSSGGYLASINPADGSRNWIKKMSEFFRMDSYAWGISGEISAAVPYYLVSTEEGVRGGWLADYVEYEAVHLDPGIPEGEEAIPGKTYNGTVTFKYADGFWDFMFADIGVFYGDRYLKLTYPDGREVEKFNWTDAGLPELGNVYELPMTKGEDITLNFSWTAGSDNTMTALINLDQKPVKKSRDEINFDNNKITVTFDLHENDVMVKIRPYMNPWITIDNPATIKSTINVKRKDNTPGNLPTKVTISGPAGTNVVNINLFPGEVKQIPYNFVAWSGGNYTITGEAWPSDNSWTDTYPPDNKDSVTIEVNLIQGPQPTDKKLHSEILDAR